MQRQSIFSKRFSLRSLLIVAALSPNLLFGCNRQPETTISAEKPASDKPTQASPAAAVVSANQPAALAAAEAELGKPAPDFTLTDLEGKPTTLSSYRGKIVVLEWFNPDCPFVKKAHGAEKGGLKSLAGKQTKENVVWLAINSAAPGKQGHGPEVNKARANEFGLTHPILLDESGKVGKLYGAKRTPHMYVIDAQGVLVYRGAIDNSPDGEGLAPTTPPLVNYVDAALADLRAGKPVATAQTEAYGCGVKYAN